jgi:hypothetical protein
MINNDKIVESAEYARNTIHVILNIAFMKKIQPNFIMILIR